MNKDRRSRLAAIVATLEQAYDDLEAIKDEEQDARDNLPQSIQDGEKGDAMQDAIDKMDSAMTGLDDAKDYLADVANG